MNPMELLNLLKTTNPKQLCYSLMGNNPFFSNLLKLGEQGKTDEIMSIARNAMKEQGKDFDKEFNTFKKILGIK